MAYKTPGKIDCSKGGVGYFITYCEHCNSKVIMRREELDILRKNLHLGCGQLPNLRVKYLVKKSLTSIAEKL